MLLAIPLLAIPLVVYNLLAFTRGDVWATTVLTVDMVRGDQFALTAGGLLVVVSLLLLFIEILKSTRTGAGSIVDHLMSVLVFVICLVEFLLLAPAATETFFILTAMALVDVIAGFSITIRGARRDIAIDPNAL
jgi:hypothetical protein